jgi:hypothetical protein
MARESDGGRFDFLWHFPSESLSTFRPSISQSNRLGLRGIAPCGVRTFLYRLTPEAILRPSKTGVKLTEINNYSSREIFRKISREPLLQFGILGAS